MRLTGGERVMQNKSAWNRGIAADVKRAKLRKEGWK